MKVEVWSDVVCPWCYIGKRRLESALSRFQHADGVEVVWRAFQLDLAAPAVGQTGYVERLATKYRVGMSEAQSMIDRMVAAGAGEGLDMRFDLARPANTFDAHRLLHLALDRGVQEPLAERLFRATFTEGAAVGDPGVLADLAVEAGLAAGEVEAVLEGDAHADDVRIDERRAAAYGITSVPFFVVDESYGVPGAQPPDVLLAVLEQAWDEAHPPPLAVVSTRADAPGCTGDSCDPG